MCLSVDVVQVMVQHIWIQSSSSGKATLLHPSFPLTLHPTSLLQEVSFEYCSLFKRPSHNKYLFTNSGGFFHPDIVGFTCFLLRLLPVFHVPPIKLVDVTWISFLTLKTIVKKIFSFWKLNRTHIPGYSHPATVDRSLEQSAVTPNPHLVSYVGYQKVKSKCPSQLRKLVIK